MLAPTDGQVVSSTTAPVGFVGATFTPGRRKLKGPSSQNAPISDATRFSRHVPLS